MTNPSSALLLLGASTRSAAFSALRAGLRPWCADLFADRDLLQRVPCRVLDGKHYPKGFVDLVADAPAGPWMYTGGLENAPAVLKSISASRSLWGNGPDVLALARDPFFLSESLRRAGFYSPRCLRLDGEVPSSGRWLLKPHRGAGGSGIRFWRGETLSSRIRETHYLQEYIEGVSGAALFVGVPPDAYLLGVTRQLVGESWLHASPFHYCGSTSEKGVRTLFDALGQHLIRETNLRGLFGIDVVWRDDVPWLIEVNPRYTASVEVLEHATGLVTLTHHREAFVGTVTVPNLVPTDTVGKAIYFAPHTLTFPDDGPWMESLLSSRPVESMPDFADIPKAGEVIEKGRPVLTFFARAPDETACRDRLRKIAYNLDRLFDSGETT